MSIWWKFQVSTVNIFWVIAKNEIDFVENRGGKITSVFPIKFFNWKKISKIDFLNALIKFSLLPETSFDVKDPSFPFGQNHAHKLKIHISLKNITYTLFASFTILNKA